MWGQVWGVEHALPLHVGWGGALNVRCYTKDVFHSCPPQVSIAAFTSRCQYCTSPSVTFSTSNIGPKENCPRLANLPCSRGSE